MYPFQAFVYMRLPDGNTEDSTQCISVQAMDDQEVRDYIEVKYPGAVISQIGLIKDDNFDEEDDEDAEG